MDLTPTDLDGVVVLTPRAFGDNRGSFFESYNAVTLLGLGIDTVFVQDNQSFSAEAGTIRGLHFQSPPHAQAKLVRVLAGEIFDVAVDIRRGSPTAGPAHRAPHPLWECGEAFGKVYYDDLRPEAFGLYHRLYADAVQSIPYPIRRDQSAAQSAQSAVWTESHAVDDDRPLRPPSSPRAGCLDPATRQGPPKRD